MSLQQTEELVAALAEQVNIISSGPAIQVTDSTALVDPTRSAAPSASSSPLASGNRSEKNWEDAERKAEAARKESDEDTQGKAEAARQKDDQRKAKKTRKEAAKREAAAAKIKVEEEEDAQRKAEAARKEAGQNARIKSEEENVHSKSMPQGVSAMSNKQRVLADLALLGQVDRSRTAGQRARPRRTAPCSSGTTVEHPAAEFDFQSAQ